MSFNLTGGNPRAHRIRVYYEGTSTIYEGMPVCYNYDTTDNWHGGSMTLGAVTETGTTAEGSQNEGKYIRVENPADNNLTSFAGVVAKGSPGIGGVGPSAVDVYVPNGAIVPVRCDVDTTVGVTILAIAVASQELGYVLSGTTRPVGIAAETETGLDGTTGITFCKLDPNMFIYQNLDGTALELGVGTSSQRLNEIVVSTAHTGGYFNNLLILTTDSGDMAAAGGVCGLNSTTYITGSQTSGGYNRAVLATLAPSGTFNSGSIHLYGAHVQIGGSPTLTAVQRCAGLCVEYATTIPTAGDNDVLFLYANPSGGDLDAYVHMYGDGEKAEVIWKFSGCGGLSTSVLIKKMGTGGMWTNTGVWGQIPIDISGTTYYIPYGALLSEA